MYENSPLPPAVLKAAQIVGSVHKLAKALNRSHQAIYMWKVAPAEVVLKIVKLTKGRVSATELRPDLYPRGTKLPKSVTR